MRKRRCPYCGEISFQVRTIRHEVRTDGETGEVIFRGGDDYHTCPICKIPLGSSYGIHIQSSTSVTRRETRSD